MGKQWIAVMSLCGVLASVASATPRLVIEQTSHDDGVATAVFLDVGDANGTFNTFSVEFTPEVGEFLNFDADGVDQGAILRPGDAASFTNVLLPAPPVVGGHSLTLLRHGNDSAEQISYSAARVGQYFNFSHPVFLNNLFLPHGVTAQTTVWLIDGEGEIFDVLAHRRVVLHPNPLPFPEPTSSALISVGLLGVLTLRRRTA